MSKGILLVNLGSPDSTSVRDVRRYLNEFLMDGRVIDAPWLLRRFIVGMVLISRPKESAHAYEKIWTPEGSPLVVTSRHLQQKLQARLGGPVELAMRYQNPSIKNAVTRLRDSGVDDLLVIPLFPHYAASSFESAGGGESSRRQDRASHQTHHPPSVLRRPGLHHCPGRQRKGLPCRGL